MFFKRILFLVFALFTTLAAVSLQARIVGAATYTRHLSASNLQKVYLFSVDNAHKSDSTHTRNMTTALQQLGENSFCLIQSHKARVGGYNSTLDSCKNYENMIDLGQKKLSEFYEDVAFERLKTYHDQPFVQYYGSILGEQEKFFKENFSYGKLQDATISHMHAFNGQFKLGDKSVQGSELLKHYATQRLSIEILHALYTTNKEHIVICAEADAIGPVCKQLQEAHNIYTKVVVRSDDQQQRAGMPQQIKADEYIACAASLIAANNPPLRLASRETLVPVYRNEQQKGSSEKPQLKSTSASKYLMAGLFAVALVVYFHKDIKSIISSIWRSIFAPSKPASALQ